MGGDSMRQGPPIIVNELTKTKEKNMKSSDDVTQASVNSLDTSLNKSDVLIKQALKNNPEYYDLLLKVFYYIEKKNPTSAELTAKLSRNCTNIHTSEDGKKLIAIFQKVLSVKCSEITQEYELFNHFDVLHHTDDQEVNLSGQGIEFNKEED